MILNLTIVYLYFSFKLFYSFHSASGYLVVWVSGVDCLGTSINRRIPPITLPAFPTGVSGDSNHMGPHCRLYYIISNLVGGLEHLDYFPFHIILPIDFHIVQDG